MKAITDFYVDDTASVGCRFNCIHPDSQLPTDAHPIFNPLNIEDIEDIFDDKLDITSKLKSKTIISQPKKMELLHYIIVMLCKKSNNGQISFTLKQDDYIGHPLPSGKIIDDKLFKKCKKLLKEYVIDEISAMVPNIKAADYRFKESIYQYFPYINNDNAKEYRPYKKTIELFSSYDLDIKEKKCCVTCGEVKYITQFKLFQEHGGLIAPVCKDCEYQRKGKIYNEEAWKNGWNFFYKTAKMMSTFSLNVKDYNDLHLESSLINFDSELNEKIQEITKVCSCCQQEKSLNAFGKNGKSLRSDCKKCVSAKKQEQRKLIVKL